MLKYFLLVLKNTEDTEHRIIQVITRLSLTFLTYCVRLPTAFFVSETFCLDGCAMEHIVAIHGIVPFPVPVLDIQ